MEYWELLVALVVGMAGSSGIWGYAKARADRRDGTADMLRGLAQHMIVAEGNRLIEQGYVTMDEYRNLHQGLFKPYVQLGGNGLAEKIVKEVDKLPTFMEHSND